MGCLHSVVASGGEIILPDISLPPNDKFLQHQFTIKRNNAKFHAGDSFDTDLKVAVESLVGTAKSDQTILEDLHRIIIEKYLTLNPELPEDYMKFGSNDFVSNLEALVKSNPFYASTLSSKSNESKAILCINAIATSQDTWFSRIIDSLDFQYPRVNIEFDHNLKVKQYSVYRIENGEKKDITLEITVNQACVSMIVLISFYAQTIHTVIHIYTYLLTSAISFATITSHPLIFSFFQTYLFKVQSSYFKMTSQLLHDNGILVNGHFKADYMNILVTAKDIICEWGTYNSATEFLHKFLFSAVLVDHAYLVDCGVLSEFLKHLELIDPYTTDIITYFEKISTNLDDTNTRLINYLSQCGTNISQMSSLKTWLETMTVIGLFHGASFSMSRILLHPTVLQQINSTVENYDENDCRAIFIYLEMIIGIQENYHIFSSKLVNNKDENTRNKNANNSIHDNLKYDLNGILQKYEILSNNYKNEYFLVIKSDPDFYKFGWIWSDYISEEIDAKQLTFTSYI